MWFRKNLLKSSALLLLISFLSVSLFTQTVFAVNPDETSPKNQITFDDLTIEQEIGQTLMIALDLHKINNYRRIIKKGIVGGVLLQWGDYSLAETKKLVDKLQSWSKIPLLVAVDYEGGVIMAPSALGLVNLPTNMMLGAADSEKDSASLFYLAGMELKRAGINVNFAPVLDVNTNMHNPAIGVRSFGSDTELAGKLGGAVISGLQAAGVAAVAKHFPGHGDVALDTHRTTVQTNMTAEKLERVHIAPFKDAIKESVMGIMTSHIKYNSLDNKNIATFSSEIIENILRKKMGYEGVIISDSLDMKAARRGVSISEAAVKALNAGIDLLIIRGANPYKVYEKIKDETAVSLKPSRLADASRKVFKLKQKLKLFNGNGGKVPLTDKAYRNLAGVLARKAVTLVRDKKNIIPFKNNVKKHASKICTVFFSPPRFAQDLVNIGRPFIENGYMVTQYNGEMHPSEDDYKYANQCIKNSDLAVIGSFQWANKPSYTQVRVVNKLLQNNKPIVLISLMSPYDIRYYLRADTALAIYGITAHSVKAAADIILGKVKPKGELPVELLPYEQLSKHIKQVDGRF